jgi:DNA-binding MarR family transcriptional regulator
MNKSTYLSDSARNLSQTRTWQTGILQSGVHRDMKKLSDGYLKQYDLTTMHWFILGAVLDAGDDGIRLTDLAERVGTTLGYLTNAVNNLELKHMMVRLDHMSDSRTKILIIDPDFRSQCEVIERGLRKLLREEFYQKVSREELQQYVSVLEKLSAL